MKSKEVAKINRDMLMLKEDQAPKVGASLSQSKRRNISIVGIKPIIPDLNVKPCSDSNEEEKGEITKAFQNFAGLKSHDACYVDHKRLYELEVEIIARLPCFEYWKLQFLNKKFLELLKRCEIIRLRQQRGLVKPYCGTQLIVIGREIEGIVEFHYELDNHKWFKGPSMITPRVMYGGIQMDGNGNPIVVQTVEKYNADTKSWTMTNGTQKARKFSSGCFLRGKFYVLGGRDENDKHLTCGESYDEATNSWELIPDMLKDMTFIMHSQTPPLIAVVDENLYMLETSLNELRGIAFKSMGDRLLVVGTSHSWHRTTKVYSCCPSPDVEEQHWEELKYWCAGAELPQFIHNCSVMFA
ncbi:hypothetical protein N665_0187s0014 [Sinapis alba]|nr:hypothetical protein N665_0187s0014 [Sinapis alba]